MFWLGLRWQDDPTCACRPDSAASGLAARPGARRDGDWLLAVALLMLVAPPSTTRPFAARVAGEACRIARTAVRLPTARRAGAGRSPGRVDGGVRSIATAWSNGRAPTAAAGRRWTCSSRSTAWAERRHRDDLVRQRAVRARSTSAWPRSTVCRSKTAGRRSARTCGCRRADGAQYLVWHWYMLGDRSVTSAFAVKALEAMAWLTREAATRAHRHACDTARTIQAHERLQVVRHAHPAVRRSGFAAEACGE